MLRVVHGDLSVLRAAAGRNLEVANARRRRRGNYLACAGRLLKPLLNVGGWCNERRTEGAGEHRAVSSDAELLCRNGKRCEATAQVSVQSIAEARLRAESGENQLQPSQAMPPMAKADTPSKRTRMRLVRVFIGVGTRDASNA